MTKYLSNIKFFLQLLLFCGLLVFLNIFPGQVQGDWFGYRVTAPIAILIVVIFLLLAVLSVIYRLWRNLWGIPEAYQNFLLRKKKIKGHQLLVDGLTAIAAGQPKEAHEFVELARELIPDYPLTLFVAAQSSYITGDQDSANQYFNRMLKDQRLMFLGLKGLITQAKDRQDFFAVREFLLQAHRIRPDSPWILNEVLRNDIMLAKKGSIYVLDKTTVPKYLDKWVWQRHQAAIAWLKAQHNIKSLSLDGLENLYQTVHDNAKDLVLPAIKLAEIFIQKQQNSKAQKVIMSTYKRNPHRALAKVWESTNTKNNDEVEVYRFLEKLTDLSPNHYESLIIIAQAGINARLWGQAKQHLNKLLDICETQFGCKLMATLEELQNPQQNLDKVRYWWQRALSAGLDSQWYCRNCNAVFVEWDIICNHCGVVDQIDWITQTVSGKVFEQAENCHVLEHHII